MRMISRRQIVEFVRKHPTTKPNLEQWYRVVKQTNWQSLVEVKRVYPHADLVGWRTVFNFAGNNFRLVAHINYRRQAVFILAILTHAAYSKEEWEE